jgi:2'-5' RNA ligase
MRLFVAVELGDDARAGLARVSDHVRARAAAVAPRARLTWVAADRLHLTVRFIGEVDDTRASAIAAALAPPLAVPPFEITMTELGAFPLKGPPRVFWVGVGRGRDEMTAVEREIGARLAACGVSPEARPYRPHVTLARVREAHGLRARDVLDAAPRGPFGVSVVDAITLFESRLSPRGSTYVALRRTPLG